MESWKNDFDKVGYVVKGSFHCDQCARALDCPVFRINVGIYSQQCAMCGQLVVEGAKRSDGSPLCLFETPLTKDELLEYRGEIAAAQVSEDWEAFASTEREMVRRLLGGWKSVSRDQLDDCVGIVQSVLNTNVPRW